MELGLFQTKFVKNITKKCGNFYLSNVKYIYISIFGEILIKFFI
jgi:hypothetical protein